MFVAPRIYSASLDNTVRVWDPYDFSCLRILEETDSEISSMCLSSSRGTIITGHDDGCVRVWDVDTGRLVLVLHPLAIISTQDDDD